LTINASDLKKMPLSSASRQGTNTLSRLPLKSLMTPRFSDRSADSNRTSIRCGGLSLSPRLTLWWVGRHHCRRASFPPDTSPGRLQKLISNAAFSCTIGISSETTPAGGNFVFFSIFAPSHFFPLVSLLIPSFFPFLHFCLFHAGFCFPDFLSLFLGVHTILTIESWRADPI
jgi:hypothetical protein